MTEQNLDKIYNIHEYSLCIFYELPYVEMKKQCLEQKIFTSGKKKEKMFLYFPRNPELGPN
jgi:hypothetical protein